MRQEKFKMERQGLVEESESDGEGQWKSVQLCSGAGGGNVWYLQEQCQDSIQRRDYPGNSAK